MAFSVVGFSVPVFVVGYLLIYLFADHSSMASRAGLLAHRRGHRPWLRHLDPALGRRSASPTSR